MWFDVILPIPKDIIPDPLRVNIKSQPLLYFPNQQQTFMMFPAERRQLWTTFNRLYFFFHDTKIAVAIPVPLTYGIKAGDFYQEMIWENTGP